MRILIVETEPALAHEMREGLRRQGYCVDLARTCRQAYDDATEVLYDLVVLDPTLPDGCGLDLLRQWRREGLTSPVLVVSDRDTPDDKALGLNAGADDYLERSFAWTELLARVRCLLRRRRSEPVEELTAGNLVLDRAGPQAYCDGEPVALTARELALLEYLMLHPNRVVSRAVIAEHVWERSYEARSNVIDVIVGRLRRKLAEGGAGDMIVTVRGMGYTLRRRVVTAAATRPVPAVESPALAEAT
jgi:DNA-binding response OmpR family regulator